MDERSVTLNAEAILKKTFTPNVKGYDPDEVDSFLDCVISDYQAYEKYFADLQNYVSSLESQLRLAKDTIAQKDIDLAKAKNKVKGIKDTDNVNATNIELIRKIGVYESFLYSKGFDPTKIYSKGFDPSKL